MSNSTTHLDLIAASQANKEVTANNLFDALSPAIVYGRRASTSAGLTWGYYGGMAMVGETPTAIANGTVTLTASTTNYIEASASTGAVSVNTTGFTSGARKLYTVITGSATATSYTDHRTIGGGGGAGSDDIADAIAAHEAAANPHPNYLTQAEGDALYATAAAITAAISSHTSAGDPHPGYLTQAEGDALYAAASAISSALSAHLAAADPHPTYLTQSEGDARYAPLSQPLVAIPFYPGVPAASALMLLFPAPAGISTLTFAAALAGSSGKALVAATAQTDFDVRKNATSTSTGTSVGTIRFAAGATVPTFIAASGFTLTGGSDWLTVWAPSTPDTTLANIAASLYCTRS